MNTEIVDPATDVRFDRAAGRFRPVDNDGRWITPPPLHPHVAMVLQRHDATTARRSPFDPAPTIAEHRAALAAEIESDRRDIARREAERVGAVEERGLALVRAAEERARLTDWATAAALHEEARALERQAIVTEAYRQAYAPPRRPSFLLSLLVAFFAGIVAGLFGVGERRY